MQACMAVIESNVDIMLESVVLVTNTAVYMCPNKTHNISIHWQTSIAPYCYAHVSIRVYFPRDDTLFYTQEPVITTGLKQTR